eukprot:CAMPEP_0197026630 /NCGR_PEP_ID=MMETSP1384-20130603/6676_1 /TAXON_ID=29189 /ORGANISM="Ammonia sp." /LENGTH=446 /DNA_ID=CAMNT_0042455329 /DNA_START=26 /DNA_END=1366 /DNA_ORIENTATION=-
MACNQWIPAGLTSKASNIALGERIEYMVHNALKPIPEHKFDTIYFYLFNDRFKPSAFGAFSSITELIASKPNLYRTISSDGRAFIHSYHKQQQQHKQHSLAPINYTVPQWGIGSSTKSRIYAHISMRFKMYKHGKFLREVDLMQLLFAEQSKSYLLFGRDEDTDFCLQHISISRKHCFFQFGNDGVLYIYDVSTHGVLINERLIPKRKHVELKHKDTLKFGQSTRCYVFLVGKQKTLRNDNNKENEVAVTPMDREKEELRLQNKQQNEKINQMQQTIEKLTVDLNMAQKSVSTKSKQLVSLMEQMECLNVTNSTRKKRERRQQEVERNHAEIASKAKQSNAKKSRLSKEEKNDHDEADDEEDVVDAEEKEEADDDEEIVLSVHDKIPKRVAKIKGIDFVSEYANLSKLTVAKLRYYVDKNKIDVGRVKKAELVKVIKRDLHKHFDV